MPDSNAPIDWKKRIENVMERYENMSRADFLREVTAIMVGTRGIRDSYISMKVNNLQQLLALRTNQKGDN